MKKSLLIPLVALGLTLSLPALANVKTLSFSVVNESGHPYEITLSSKLKGEDKLSAGCTTKSHDQVIVCRTDVNGKFDAAVVATFVFTKLGEGPTLVINESGFAIKNNADNNLAHIDAKMDTEGKWDGEMKNVNITFPKQ